jgi:hypothetical protein
MKKTAKSRLTLIVMVMAEPRFMISCGSGGLRPSLVFRMERVS